MREEGITGNPTAGGAVVSIIIARRTICDYKKTLCIVLNSKKNDRPDRSSFILQDIGIVLVRSLGRQWFQLLCDQCRCVHYVRSDILHAGVLFDISSPSVLFLEMFSIVNDFCLFNLQFLWCNVALSYLVESKKSVFCHCTAAKMRHFKIPGNLVCIWN